MQMETLLDTALLFISWENFLQQTKVVPVGNAFDMTAVTFQNVMPTADTNTEVLIGASATFADYFERC